jgi:hypothetical protein
MKRDCTPFAGRLKRVVRMMKKLFSAVFVLLLLTAPGGCQPGGVAPPPTGSARSMKGYELYSWQMEGTWTFALVPGTNRIKTYDEIASPDTRVQDLETLRRELDRLASGEQVFWSEDRVPNTALPPDDVIEEVRAYCKQRDIRLEVPFIAHPAPDATLTPAPGGPTLTVSPAAPTPVEGSAAAPITIEGSTAAPTPYCRPAEASVDLSASATRLEVGQAVSVTVTLTNGDASDAKLGLIQYTLEVRPAGVLTSDELGPVEHAITLEPEHSDAVAFVLRASTPGRATLTGSTSYEMHALDYSWGSWSGCGSWPLEIVVKSATDAD